MNTPPLHLALLNAWAAIHGEYWLLWTLHWRAKGAGFYSDHLMFQRLYESRRAEIDRVAEVIAGIGGARLLDPTKAMQAATPFIQSIDALQIPDAHKGLIGAQTVLIALNTANTAAKGSPYEMAVNNALAGISDNHLEAVYLLQQRMQGRVVPPPEKTADYAPYSKEAEFVPPAGMLDIGEPDEEAASIFRTAPPHQSREGAEIIGALHGALGLLPGTGSPGILRSVAVGGAIGGLIHYLFRLIRYGGK